MDIDEKISSRYDANLQIVMILNDLVSEHPDWRFQQILQNVGISSREGKDLFYEESVDTLNRLRRNCLISKN